MEKLLTLIIILLFAQLKGYGQIPKTSCKVIFTPTECFIKKPNEDCYNVIVEIRDANGNVTEYSKNYIYYVTVAEETIDYTTRYVVYYSRKGDDGISFSRSMPTKSEAINYWVKSHCGSECEYVFK